MQPLSTTWWSIPWSSIVDFIISPLFSVFVALLTVGATFYLKEKRDTVHSLLALKNEVESNRELTADALLKLALDVQAETPGSLTPSSLNTESYVVARNNGTLSNLSEEHKRLISDHYTKIQTTNSELTKVDNLWLEERSIPENEREHIRETLLTTEQRSLEMLLMLFDDVENERIDDVQEYIHHMNKNVIGSFEYSYQSVIEAIDEELSNTSFSIIFM